MRRRGFVEDDDITDMERAIIASMIEEEERLKAMGFPPNMDIDYSSAISTVPPRSPDTPRKLDDLIHKQYAIDITDPDDPRPLGVRIQALAEERESDQRRLGQMAAAIGSLVLPVSKLGIIRDPTNIEETEDYRSVRSPHLVSGSRDEYLTSDETDDRPGLRIDGEWRPILQRQPSFHHSGSSQSNNSANSNKNTDSDTNFKPINPLMFLADPLQSGPSIRRGNDSVNAEKKELRSEPNISRSSYGFTHHPRFEKWNNKNLKDVRPFCYHWVGDVLRIQGTLIFDYSDFRSHQVPDGLSWTCRVWILPAMSLFHPVDPLDGSVGNPTLRRGDLYFYLIKQQFLNDPLSCTRITLQGINHLIYTINYDEAQQEYYLLFYETLIDLIGETPMAYSDIINAEQEQSIINVDTMVQLSFDASRDL